MQLIGSALVSIVGGAEASVWSTRARPAGTESRAIKYSMLPTSPLRIEKFVHQSKDSFYRVRRYIRDGTVQESGMPTGMEG